MGPGTKPATDNKKMQDLKVPDFQTYCEVTVINTVFLTWS